jgi:ribosomal protein L29
MKKPITTIAVLTMLIASACEPSKAEIEAREIVRQDSMKQQAIQDSIANAANEAMKEQLIDLKSQLAAAQSKLDAAQSENTGVFDGALGGKSQDDKAQDIADQTKNVETLKQQISELEPKIK